MSDQAVKKNNENESDQKWFSDLSFAPHIKAADSVKLMMWSVVAALLPAAIYAGYIFGLKALIIMGASIASAVIAETLMQLILKKPVTILNGSAFVTGLLFAMLVPADAPLWLPLAGASFAIIAVKQLFGGLGLNLFNPALGARVVLLIFWPVLIISKLDKFDWRNIFLPDIDINSGLAGSVYTALLQTVPPASIKETSKIFLDSGFKIDQLYDVLINSGMLQTLLFGNFGGGIGEASVVYILIGGVVLIYRKIISWYLPLIFIGTCGLISYLYFMVTGNPFTLINTLSSVLSGGLLLGAFFMAADPVTSPITKKGRIIFTAGCGMLTSIIQIYGSYYYGFCFAILIMNAFVPLIDRFVKPKVFGTGKVK